MTVQLYSILTMLLTQKHWRLALKKKERRRNLDSRIENIVFSNCLVRPCRRTSLLLLAALYIFQDWHWFSNKEHHPIMQMWNTFPNPIYWENMRWGFCMNSYNVILTETYKKKCGGRVGIGGGGDGGLKDESPPQTYNCQSGVSRNAVVRIHSN